MPVSLVPARGMEHEAVSYFSALAIDRMNQEREAAMSKHTRYIVQRTNVAIPHYWAGGGVWTTNPADAIRFYHKSDAATSFTLDRLQQDGHIQIDVVPYALRAGLFEWQHSPTHRIEEND